MISGKQILFISPEFFGIDRCLIDVLAEYGAKVTWFDERAVKSSFGRAINSIYPSIFNRYSDYYYRDIIEKTDYADVILIIKGDMVTLKTLKKLKNKFCNAVIILYLYDSVRNIKGIEKKLRLYDRVYSFDPSDCKKYGFKFRPLFSEFKAQNNNSDVNSHFDICFYGTMYNDRFAIVNNVKNYCNKHGLRFYSFCFLRGRFMVLYYWLTNKGTRKLGLKAISFKSKSREEIAKIIQDSKIVLDINDKNQQGLTIRTLETVLSGKKILTTNKDIVNYEFYNPNNICVFDRDCLDLPDFFFKKTPEKISKSILDKYTAKGWIRDVFEEI